MWLFGLILWHKFNALVYVLIFLKSMKKIHNHMISKDFDYPEDVEELKKRAEIT